MYFRILQFVFEKYSQERQFNSFSNHNIKILFVNMTNRAIFYSKKKKKEKIFD